MGPVVTITAPVITGGGGGSGSGDVSGGGNLTTPGALTYVASPATITQNPNLRTTANYPLEIRASGTLGSLFVQDQSGIGITKVVLESGANQGSNHIISVLRADGVTEIMSLMDNGVFAVSDTVRSNVGIFGSGTYVTSAGIQGIFGNSPTLGASAGNSTDNVANVFFRSAAVINWNADSGLARAAAGIVEANNGTGGTRAAFASGGYIGAISTKTAQYDVTQNDYTILANTTSGSFSVRLPNAPATGSIFNVKKIAAGNTLTITTPGGTVTIDGATSVNVTANNQNTQVQFDGSNYRVL